MNKNDWCVLIDKVFDRAEQLLDKMLEPPTVPYMGDLFGWNGHLDTDDWMKKVQGDIYKGDQS